MAHPFNLTNDTIPHSREAEEFEIWQLCARLSFSLALIYFLRFVHTVCAVDRRLDGDVSVKSKVIASLPRMNQKKSKRREATVKSSPSVASAYTTETNRYFGDYVACNGLKLKSISRTLSQVDRSSSLSHMHFVDG